MLRKPKRWYRPGETISPISNGIKGREEEDRDREEEKFIFRGERRWMPIVGGILFLLSASLYFTWYLEINSAGALSEARSINDYLAISFLLLIMSGILSILGRSWGFSVILCFLGFIGGLLSFYKSLSFNEFSFFSFGFIPALVGLVLIAKSKKEFS